MKAKVLAVLSAVLILSLRANAQFFSQGTDPGTVRWTQIKTPTYRIIYPEGLDSLAAVYARNLEFYRNAIGKGIGVLPNGNYSLRMPVILHPFTADANGMVTWTPRRMELQTTPEAVFPEVTEWPVQLAIHESRHVSQMQIGSSKTFRWLKYPFGQLVDGALAAIYGGPVFFEGDAVLTETALTDAGRGRSADFLEYYRACLREGLDRDYWQWLYGSQKYYTPNHYGLGYMTIAGADYLYGTNFTREFYDRIYRHGGISFLNLQKTMKEVSGKGFNTAFSEITGCFAGIWEQDERARAPFMEADTLTRSGRKYQEYKGLEVAEGAVFAVKDGLEIPATLVRIDPDGRETKVSAFRPDVSRLRYDSHDGRLYWTEIRRDPRWEMRSFSEIKYLDANGRTRFLTKGKRHYNVSVKDGMVAAAEYLEDGRSAVVVFDPDGEMVARYGVPDGMQVLEPVWAGEEMFTSALTKDGIGIYRLKDLEPVLHPQKHKIGDLRGFDGCIRFLSDLNGVTELYSLDVGDRKVSRLSSTVNGGHDFCIDGDRLIYTSTAPDGKNILSTPLSSLPVAEADFSSGYDDPVAEYLSENAGEEAGDGAVETGSPERYSKFLNLIRFHSWMPLFFNYDAISSLSFENIHQNAGLGATAFFQNDLGSASGSIGWHAQPGDGGWRHSGHARFTWSGWYPVMEASLDFNDSNALIYSVQTVKGGMKMRTQESRTPLLDFKLKTYVPLSFSSGGWNRGVIPQVTFGISNSIFGKYAWNKNFLVQCNMSRLTASLRAYSMMRIPSSCIYPKWGAGVEAGFVTRPLMSSAICSTAYGMIYGYVPGILPTHGVKLSALAVFRASEGTFAQEDVMTAPRGFNPSASSRLGRYPMRSRFSLDYALPFACVDWSGLSPFAYIRNFELTAHADLSVFNIPSEERNGNLFSVGADLAARLGNLLWVPYATRIGVSYNYNGGRDFPTMETESGQVRNSVSLLLSIDF